MQDFPASAKGISHLNLGVIMCFNMFESLLSRPLSKIHSRQNQHRSYHCQ